MFLPAMLANIYVISRLSYFRANRATLIRTVKITSFVMKTTSTARRRSIQEVFAEERVTAFEVHSACGEDASKHRGLDYTTVAANCTMTATRACVARERKEKAYAKNT